MPDIQDAKNPTKNLATIPARPAPPCPLCGGAMRLAQTHRARAAITDIFQCCVCAVQYPVVTGAKDKP